MATLGLPRIDVREVHFHERHRDPRQRIAHRERRVRVRRRIDEHPIGVPTERLDRLDQLAFAVVLTEGERHIQRARDN